MSETFEAGQILTFERELSDRDWFRAVSAALDAPLDTTLKNELIREMLRRGRMVTARVASAPPDQNESLKHQKEKAS